MDSKDKAYTVKDICRTYGVSRVTVWRWLHSGRLTGDRRPLPRTVVTPQWSFTPEQFRAVEQIIEEQDARLSAGLRERARYLRKRKQAKHQEVSRWRQ